MALWKNKPQTLEHFGGFGLSAADQEKCWILIPVNGWLYSAQLKFWGKSHRNWSSCMLELAILLCPQNHKEKNFFRPKHLPVGGVALGVRKGVAMLGLLPCESAPGGHLFPCLEFFSFHQWGCCLIHSEFLACCFSLSYVVALSYRCVYSFQYFIFKNDPMPKNISSECKEEEYEPLVRMVWLLRRGTFPSSCASDNPCSALPMVTCVVPKGSHLHSGTTDLSYTEHLLASAGPPNLCSVGSPFYPPSNNRSTHLITQQSSTLYPTCKMRYNIYNTRTLTTATSDPKQCFSNFPCIRITWRACRNTDWPRLVWGGPKNLLF